VKRILPFLGLLCLWSLGARAQAGDKHLLGLPAYPEARDSRFRGTLTTNQVPLDAAVLTTQDDMDTVMSFYRKTLRASKVEWVENYLGPETGYIGFYDPNSGTMRLVTAVAMPSGGTMLVYSSMDPRPLLQNQATVPDDLPSLPEASDVVVTETAESGERQRSVGYRISGLSRAVIEKRLIEEAAKLGWRPVKEELEGAENMLLFIKERNRCIISIREKTTEEESFFQVTMVVNDRPPANATGDQK